MLPSPQHPSIGTSLRTRRHQEHQHLTDTKLVHERYLKNNRIYNDYQADDPKKHWLMETNPQVLSEENIAVVDEVFRNRCHDYD